MVSDFMDPELCSLLSEEDMTTWIGVGGRYNGPLLPQPVRNIVDANVANKLNTK
ncbi:MAG: hypothetical protein ACJA2R_000248 [Saprospiraceae bacterium]|jgi:hypothetical protein|tara:strand:- start:277 stop:438 length:162 start_codon:yes stop_codon:yes gene_type:complete